MGGAWGRAGQPLPMAASRLCCDFIIWSLWPLAVLGLWVWGLGSWELGCWVWVLGSRDFGCLASLYSLPFMNQKSLHGMAALSEGSQGMELAW